MKAQKNGKAGGEKNVCSEPKIPRSMNLAAELGGDSSRFGRRRR
jgi:hypothetical protein